MEYRWDTLLVTAIFTLALVLWVLAIVRGRALEWFTGPGQLPVWMIPVSEFVAFVAAIGVGSMVFGRLAVWWFKIDPQVTPLPARSALIAAASMQLAWVAVAFAFRALGIFRPARGPTSAGPAAIAGVAGYLLSLPAVGLAILVWTRLLTVLGVDVGPQDTIHLLRQAKTMVELLAWVALVAVIVPIAEELVFRQVLYRFLAARMPDWSAILMSSVLFGVLHFHVASALPLAVLGVALCLAYRYTGRLITPIVMHALFNFATLVLVRLEPGS